MSVSTSGALAATVTSVPDGGARLLDPQHLGDHVDRLYRAAMGLCGDSHDAEDLVQETYARVLARPRFLRHDDDLGYLLKVLRNTFLNRVRTQKRKPPPLALDVERDGLARSTDPRQPEAALEVTELLGAIAELPPDQRDAIVAIDIVGLSYREAGRVLGAKEATITTRLHRGRSRLAHVLRTLPTATFHNSTHRR